MVTVNKHRHAVKVGDSITALEEWLAQFSLLGYAEAVPWLRQLCLKTSNPEHHEAFIKPGFSWPQNGGYFSRFTSRS